MVKLRRKVPKRPVLPKVTYDDMIKDFRSLTGSRSLWEIYNDFIEMSAISIQNSCELVKDRKDKKEGTYLDIVKKYNKEQLNTFAKLLAGLICMLENNTFQDLLGDLYMRLNFGDKRLGQVFTPYNVAKMMAKMTYNEKVIKNLIKEKGYFTIQEPCIGGGANVIALCDILHENRINYQRHLIIVGQDLSRIAALQAYITLSLIGCRAVIKVGNTLTEPYTGFYNEIKKGSELWYTPFYAIGGKFI